MLLKLSQGFIIDIEQNNIQVNGINTKSLI